MPEYEIRQSLLGEDEIWKKCRGACGEFKPLDEFHNDRHSVDGKTARCKEDNNAASRAYWNSAASVQARSLELHQGYRATDPERYRGYHRAYWEHNPDWMQDKRLRDHYNKTLDYYYETLEEQNGCGVCHTQEPGGRSGRWFQIDHDHACVNGCSANVSCGLCVRGLVCHRCNTYVIPVFEGRRNGDIEDLREAVEDYINAYLIRRAVLDVLSLEVV